MTPPTDPATAEVAAAPLRAATIVHADLDAFYASVEELDRPELAGQPLVVARSDGRGVVATANYPARVYGIHSAMSAAEARKRCPHAVFVDPNPDRYRALSAVVLACYEPLLDDGGTIETLGLDEAYLDLTHLRLDDDALAALLATLRATVCEATGGLTVSVGAAGSKTAAKLASEAAKPDGALVVAVSDELAFLRSHPIGAIPGIGPKSAVKLTDFARIRTLADVDRSDDALLDELLGSRAGWLRELAATGHDGKRLVSDRAAKQHGSSRTYPQDLTDPDAMDAAVDDLAAAAAGRLERDQARGRTVTLTVRLPDRTTRSYSRTLPGSVAEAATIAQVGRQLLAEHRPGAVRLLGVTVSNLTRHASDELFSYDPDSWLTAKRHPGRRTARAGRPTAGDSVTHPTFGPGQVHADGASTGTVHVAFDDLGFSVDVTVTSVTVTARM